MQVDETNKKRDRKFHDTREEDVEGEEKIPVPTEMAQEEPPKKLTLADIMNFMKTGLQESKESIAGGMHQNREKFSSLSRELSATKREAQEGKIMAAKAATIAQETQNKVDQLDKRVLILEKNPQTFVSPPPGLRPQNAQSPEGKRDWDELGGEEGDTAIVGGFRPFADKDEK